MKPLKNTLTALVVLATVLSGFNSCKKSEDDPFFSLKSRKARLIGKWECNSGDLTETWDYGDESMIFNYEDINEDLEFEKDNTYSLTRTMSAKFEYYGQSFLFDIAQTESGTWSFGGENKDLDLKNKEYLVMNVEKSDYTIIIEGDKSTSTFEPYTYMLTLTKLSNKELSTEMEAAHIEMGDGYSSYSKIKGELSYEKKK